MFVDFPNGYLILFVLYPQISIFLLHNLINEIRLAKKLTVRFFCMLEVSRDYRLEVDYVMLQPLVSMSAPLENVSVPIAYLARYLTDRDLCRLSCISRKWNKLISFHDLWEMRFKQRFSNGRLEYLSWKEQYKRAEILQQEVKLQKHNISLLRMEEHAMNKCMVMASKCGFCIVIVGIIVQIAGLALYENDGRALLWNDSILTVLKFSVSNHTRYIPIYKYRLQGISQENISVLLIANRVQAALWLNGVILSACALNCVPNLSRWRVCSERAVSRIAKCIAGNMLFMSTIPPIVIGSLGIANHLTRAGVTLVVSGSAIALVSCSVWICDKAGRNLYSLFSRVRQVFKRCCSTDRKLV